MKFLSTAAVALAALPFASAFRKGFNVAAERPDGSCKTQADWEKNFNTIKSFPGNFRDARVYASSDCNTLQQAVPAALNTGFSLLVGVWTENDDHYNAEKNALLAAAKQYGVRWISAISVGSEDLYRKDTNAQKLAGQIYDVRGMMSTVGGKGIWVGHVDTWTAWVDDANADVIKACDFIGMDAYPYFQGSTIQDSKNVFQEALDRTSAKVQQYNPGKPVWVTETGWPSAGPAFGASTSSVANQQTFWTNVICPLFPQRATFAYTLRDYYVAPNSPAFGVVDYNFQPHINLAC